MDVCGVDLPAEGEGGLSTVVDPCSRRGAFNVEVPRKERVRWVATIESEAMEGLRKA